MREKILDYITYLALLFFAFLVFFLLDLLFEKNVEKFIALVQVIVWPSVILVGFLFFRKLFAYLFLSIEEFNFFGVSGRLRSVTEVIEEKAKKLHEQEKKEEDMQRRQAEVRIQLDKLKSLPEANDFEKMYSELFEDYKITVEENIDSLKREEELKAEIASLEARIPRENETGNM